MPKYEIKLYQNVFSSPLLSWGIGIPCFLLSLPVLYALFALGFKKFKQEKVIEVPADAPYSGVAVASFVTGLVGLLLGPFLTIPALITGILGLRDTKKRHVKGVAFSWIGIMIFIFHTFYLYGIILMIVYFMQLPGTLSGDKDAVKHMSKDELQYYNAKLAKIKPNTSQEMLEKLLGKPYNVSNLASTGTYQYHCPEDLTMDCSITVTTSDKVISAISWLDIKRFMYTKNFTDSDKVYMYDKFDLTLTLLPTWSEYTYSEQELKDDPPITFMRSKNNSGYLYVYVNTLKDNDKFDIRQVIKDLEEPVTDFKQSSEQGLDIYEFRSKKDKELRYYSYRVKGKVIIGSLYYVKEAYFNKDELDEALNIAKTIDIVNK